MNEATHGIDTSKAKLYEPEENEPDSVFEDFLEFEYNSTPEESPHIHVHEYDELVTERDNVTPKQQDIFEGTCTGEYDEYWQYSFSIGDGRLIEVRIMK